MLVLGSVPYLIKDCLMCSSWLTFHYWVALGCQIGNSSGRACSMPEIKHPNFEHHFKETFFQKEWTSILSSAINWNQMYFCEFILCSFCFPRFPMGRTLSVSKHTVSGASKTPTTTRSSSCSSFRSVPWGNIA